MTAARVTRHPRQIYAPIRGADACFPGINDRHNLVAARTLGRFGRAFSKIEPLGRYRSVGAADQPGEHGFKSVR